MSLESTSGKRNWAQAKRKVISAVEMIPGRASGSTMCQSVCSRLAPSTIAASSRLTGMLEK